MQTGSSNSIPPNHVLWHKIFPMCIHTTGKFCIIKSCFLNKVGGGQAGWVSMTAINMNPFQLPCSCTFDLMGVVYGADNITPLQDLEGYQSPQEEVRVR